MPAADAADADAAAAAAASAEAVMQVKTSSSPDASVTFIILGASDSQLVHLLQIYWQEKWR